MAAVSDILASLTLPQREAVTHVEGPLLILAGPGSGKTRVVTHRIAYLLEQGIPAREILAITFTNKAADEMRSRVARLAPGRKVWVGTFHGFCASLLRRHAEFAGLAPNFSIYDPDDSLDVLKRAVLEANVVLSHFTPEKVARAISWAKNEVVTPARFTPSPHNPIGPMVAAVYPVYQRLLQQANAVDFDDLLLHVAEMLRENPELRQSLDERYGYILVDEYQDTNLAQYAIVRALSQNRPNLAVTGDPDQSIYGWRGANLNNILEFEHDYPQVKVVRLEQNYRSTGHIVHVADTLIRYNVKRKAKNLFTENEEGNRVRLALYATYLDEARDIAAQIALAVQRGEARPRDFAILYRVSALSRSLEQGLRSEGLPYQIVKGLEFYQRREVKDILAYLLLINNPRDEQALRRAINVPARGIGKASLQKLAAHAAHHRLSLLEAARQAGLVPGLSKKALVALASFVALYDRLCLGAEEPVGEVVARVLQETGYRDMLHASDDAEDEDRLANLDEFAAAAAEFDARYNSPGGLEHFLEQVVLVNETDAWESESDLVTLMTLHAAKGLEFPHVFIVGLEQGLLPHQRASNSREQVEEERRLLFVGITRAMRGLQLSMAEVRPHQGGPHRTVPSEFFLNLPRAEMDMYKATGVRPPRDPECQLDDADQEPLDHDSLDQDSHDHHSADEGPPPTAARQPRRVAAPPLEKPVRNEHLEAAAQILAPGGILASFPPERFVAGMLVQDPDYGLGEIITITGEGKKRQATIRFHTGGVERKFLLAFRNVVPANLE